MVTVEEHLFFVWSNQFDNLSVVFQFLAKKNIIAHLLICLKMTSSERAYQEEQNGANFSFIAPSSEELRVPILASHSNVHTW